MHGGLRAFGPGRARMQVRERRVEKLEKERAAATPAADVSQGVPPWASDIACAGMMRLQTEAATMMPAAKPSETVSASSAPGPRFAPGFRKKTAAAPSVVQRKVKPVATAVWASALRISGVMRERPKA